LYFGYQDYAVISFPSNNGCMNTPQCNVILFFLISPMCSHTENIWSILPKILNWNPTNSSYWV